MKTIKLTRPERFGRWLGLYRLYMEAFPRAERKPFSMIVRMYRRKKTDIWCVEADGRFSGLGITINGKDAILLDYFAIVKERRGEGVGTAALKALMEHYAGKGFFLEIESTREQVPEQALRRRRKRFYLSAGLQELHTTAKLFGVEMELLGKSCQMDFDRYKAFYRDNYSQWAADHVTPSAIDEEKG